MDDTYKNTTGIHSMEVNKNITDAARQVVRSGDIEEGVAYQIPGYKGMCVGIFEEGVPKAALQPMSFFSEGNRRYAFGPQTK